MIKRFAAALAAVVALAVPAMAMAQSVDTRGLTETQVVELQKQAALAREGTSATASPEQQVQRVSQYVEIGKSIGAGIGSAAKELNVAVNDFAKTPVGQMTMFLIVYKVIGAKIIGILASILWFSFALPTWLFAFVKICMANEVRETFDPTSGKRISRTVVPQDLDDGVLAGYRFVFVLVLGGIVGIGSLMAFAS